MDDDKVLENRLRRMADRQGYRLEKSRARDPRALTFQRYRLFNLQTSAVEFGYADGYRTYTASLEDIEQFLTAPRKSAKKGGAR